MIKLHSIALERSYSHSSEGVADVIGDDDGYTLYYNAKSGESSWEHPAAS